MRYSCPSCGAPTVTQFLVQADRCGECGAGLQAEDVEVEAGPVAERTTDPALLLLAEMVSMDPFQADDGYLCVFCSAWAGVDQHDPACPWLRAGDLLAALPPGTVPTYITYEYHWHGEGWHHHGLAEVGHTHDGGEPAAGGSGAFIPRLRLD